MTDQASARDGPPLSPPADDAAVTRVLEICNKKGLHARASAKFVQTVEKFEADVKVKRGQAARLSADLHSGSPTGHSTKHCGRRSRSSPQAILTRSNSRVTEVHVGIACSEVVTWCCASRHCVMTKRPPVRLAGSAS